MHLLMGSNDSSTPEFSEGDKEIVALEVTGAWGWYSLSYITSNSSSPQPVGWTVKYLVCK